ncbi:MAG: DUF6502 family protein, partial [Steroidobacteraceae bacterium]
LSNLVDPKPFIELIGLWSRNPDYLDEDGLPRDLSVTGRFGFATLVRRSNLKVSTSEALSILLEYGNVELVKRKVKLTKPFFHIRSNETLAFEPSVRFLLDAAGNVSSSLSKGEGSDGKLDEHFWRSVDTHALPQAKRKEYLAFVKASSLSFLQDIDDWLSEHACAPASRAKKVRVGLGLFTLESENE